MKSDKFVDIELVDPVQCIVDEETAAPKTNQRPSVKLTQLYRFTQPADKFILLLTFLASVSVGVLFPLNILIYRQVINVLVAAPGTSVTTAGTKEPYHVQMTPMILHFGLVAISGFIAGFLQAICVSLMSERLGRRLRLELYAGYLRQESAWIDKQQSGKLVVQMADDIETIQTASTDKMAQFIQQISTFISSLIIAFVSDWRLTLIAMLCLPLMILTFSVLIRFVKRYAAAQVMAYSTAGGIAEEILSGLKTIVAFNAQEKEVDRYTKNLHEAEKYGVKKSIFQGLASGFIPMILYSVAGLVFYMGLGFYEKDMVEAGIIIQIFITVVVGCISLGNTIPQLENIIQAKAAAYHIFQIIDRKPTIDHREVGEIPQSFKGDIEFKNINFNYPSRPNIPILKNFNFTIPQGKTVAFIGPSGSGKSTIVHLLQRLYDPDSGEINLDGTNLKVLDLSWYRSNVSVVQQEPPLFSGTIEDNIRLGKLDATYEEIEEAAQKSNAFDFIMDTTNKFQTELGDLGSGFSGGQKQRIAIATALIGLPSLLLLDEATSALDNESERLVQATIDQNICNQGDVTVVMVAHRLQTVRNADVIVVMKSGEIVEQGNHDELIEQKGLYYEMLMKQNSTENDDEDNSDEDSDIDTKPDVDLNDDSLMYEVEKRIYSSTTSLDQLVGKKKSTKMQNFYDFIRLMKFNKPEAKYVTMGLIASVFLGILTPLASLIYAQLFQIFEYKYTDIEKFHRHRSLLSGFIAVPGFCMMICSIFKNIGFGKSGEALTTRLRKYLMSSILNQEIAWFDIPENQPGRLASRLALEANLVKGAAGPQMGIIIEAIMTLISTFIIGFVFSWQLSLMFFVLIPLIVVSGIMQGRNSGMQQNYSPSGMKATSLVLESLNKVKVIHTLGLQNYFHNKYLVTLKSDRKGRSVRLILYGLFSAVGASALYMSYCVVFLIGGYLLDAKQIEVMQLMRVFSCLTMSSTSLGRALAMSPDIEKARRASRKTIETIDRVSEIDSSPNKGVIPDEKFSGKVEFVNVNFRYPSRPKIPVLRDFNHTIEQNKSTALVGHSGCGKSTVIQLIERFYDCGPSHKGELILFDGHDVKTLNLRWLRSQIGLVEQEPTLFNISVKDNITLGIPDQEIEMDRVLTVAKMANIDEFVQNLPDTYDTKVGQRGGHLSGGQKQRICIARALYRQPSLLLLDEATSALDTESESLVQAALFEASKGRTCISIAHRLSSIRDFADTIVVLENGRVLESGSHDELMQIKQGKYRALYAGTVMENS